MAIAGFPLLVVAHLGDGGVIGFGVVLNRDLRRHAAHGKGAAAVAGADQFLAVAVQEVHGHGDLAAVGQGEVRPVPEALYEAENIVPAAAVEAGHVVPELVEDLVHLEDRHDGLDQDGRLDGADRQTQVVLGMDEDVVPEPRLQMVLQLGQVVVGAGAAGDQRLGVVEEMQAEIRQSADYRLAVDADKVVRQMPAARAHDQTAGCRPARSVCLIWGRRR